MLRAETPALILAPMDGFTDFPMRALQGELGAFCFAVSEFQRVSTTALPAKVFHREVPELLNSGKTASGMPVQVQILGGHPELMAESAVNAVEAGATSIDINFGCPAPTVNRNDGGATILQHPKRIRTIISQVRQAVPHGFPVSAKVRLGWENIDEIDEIAAAVEEAQAAWLVVHARTKMQKYAPPVYWKRIGRVRERLTIPVVANGDIWTIDDFRRCREETGCRHFMLGRGALADPRLAPKVALELGLIKESRIPHSDWNTLLHKLYLHSQCQTEKRTQLTLHRLKQWLNLAKRFGHFQGFDEVKRTQTVPEFFLVLRHVLSVSEREPVLDHL